MWAFGSRRHGRKVSLEVEVAILGENNIDCDVVVPAYSLSGVVNSGLYGCVDERDEAEVSGCAFTPDQPFLLR